MMLKKQQKSQELTKTKKPVPTKKDSKNSKTLKEGFLLKRKSKRIRQLWKKYYVVLEGSKLKFYQDESKEEMLKFIELKKAKAISFHYDENAPKKSKKIGLKDNDETRFDLYMSTNSKKYKFKSEDESVWESEAWVQIIKDVIDKYSED